MRTNFFVLLLLIPVTLFAQRFGGIEVGGKGIKVAVVDVRNVQTGDFTVVKTWTVNTAVTKNISVDKRLAKEDIQATAGAVGDIFKQLQAEFSLTPDRIFTIGSSGVAMATNRADLSTQIRSVIGTNLDFINSDQEGKLVTKGAVPVSRYKNSLIVDIGGGNTKGGYVSQEGGNYYFQPVAIDFGSVTFTEFARRRSQSGDFNGGLRASVDTLRYLVHRMYDNQPASRFKKNVYFIGGASWAFANIMQPTNTDAYMTFNPSDVMRYQDLVQNHYDKLVSMAGTNENVQKVLETYSQEGLLAGSYILRYCIEDLNNPEGKEYFFVRQGHVAWIIAYVVDRLRGRI